MESFLRVMALHVDNGDSRSHFYGVLEMILDVHGPNAARLVEEAMDIQLPPFSFCVVAKNGEDAIDADDKDRLVFVVDGFPTAKDKQEVLDHFVSRRDMPGILEILITPKAMIKKNARKAAQTPYNSVVYLEGSGSFLDCVIQCVATEIVTSEVQDLFGDAAALLVNRYYSNALSPYEERAALDFIEKVNGIYDSGRDDVPELH
jgi:hypothetical protein